MARGLNILKNCGKNVLLDADNLFWAVTPPRKDPGFFIPRETISLYERFNDKLDKELNDFRFGQELSAIYIDPTDRCNADCSYCYVPDKIRKEGRSMTAEELDFILEKLAKRFMGARRKQVIIFHASEPLLVKDILFAAIHKYRDVFKFGLQTNAILLEAKDVEFLKKYGVGVGISLDSFSAAANDRTRRTSGSKGNFHNAVRAIEWFDGYEGLNVITTVTKTNVKDLPGLVGFLHSKKVPCVLMNPVRFTRIPVKAFKAEDEILAKYFIDAVETAIRLSRSSDHGIIVGNFANTIMAIVAPSARRLMCDISPCGGGRCFFTITASGDMIPCGEFIGLKGFSGGNIFRDSVDSAMRSRPFARIRARVVEKIAECRDCSYRNICGAPCPAELHSSGNMYDKSIFCEFYKRIIDYAFKIIAEGREKHCFRKESLGSLEYEYCSGIKMR